MELIMESRLDPTQELIKAESKAVIDYLKARNLIFEVDGNPPAEEVSRQVIEKLSVLQIDGRK